MEKLQEDVIDIELTLDPTAILDYKLGKELYKSYLRHFIDNNIDNKIIRVSFDARRRRYMPLSFLSGLTDAIVEGNVSRDRVTFKLS